LDTATFAIKYGPLRPNGSALAGVNKMEKQPPFIHTFFSEDSLKGILTYLCNTRAPGTWDPVTATVLDLLNSKLQFCLSANGLLPIKGRPELVYPYHMMSGEQKDFIRQALQDRAAYTICNDAVVFHNFDVGRLDPVMVLEAMCCKILESNVHKEHSVRIGVCNILLQRVQSVVPISKGVQQRLNALLFGDK
jgi:hypothetical protein